MSRIRRHTYVAVNVETVRDVMTGRLWRTRLRYKTRRFAQMKQGRPKFAMVHRGEEWSVQAEWPDGTIETPIRNLKSEQEALAWINQFSESWLRDRTM